jgi:uncharacterized protein YeaO (DUF488 family)
VKPQIAVKRVYGDVPTKSDGCRILAERLWPRGLKKEALKLDFWLRDVAPSTTLRKWFGHDPKKWDAFRQRYFKELDANSAAVDELREHARKEKVTLLFSSRDEEHNNVIALREYLLTR